MPRSSAGRVVPRDEGAGHVSSKGAAFGLTGGGGKPRRVGWCAGRDTRWSGGVFESDLDQVPGNGRRISTRPLVPRGLLDQRMCSPAGRVVPRDEGAGHVSRPRPSPQGSSPDLDTAARHFDTRRSFLALLLSASPRGLLDQRMCSPAGRVVPRDEGAGHVSRPRPSPRGRSPDLDTPPRSSSAIRSADVESRWSSSAPRRRSRARVETG